jgi:hypothetical protein
VTVLGLVLGRSAGNRAREAAARRPLHRNAWLPVAGRCGAVQAYGETALALRMLFDWLVVGHIIESSPAHAVRGRKYSQMKGKTPVLDREEAQALTR